MEEIDYHKEEIDLWNSKVTWEEVTEFCNKHRVDIMVQADTMYHCFIDFKTGDGSYSQSLTFVGSLKQAIWNYGKASQ